MTDALPDHPAIITRRTHAARRQRETFEPVAVPGDTRRYRPVSAILPSLVGLFLFAIVAAYVIGFAGVFK